MTSMQDIADLLGVSKATVSLVLSGKSGSRVSEKMKAKVISAADELGYRPNDLARSLRTGKTNLISVLVTDISNEFFGKLSFFIQEEAKKYGYVVITANTNESDQDLDAMVQILVSKQVDGIIVVPTEGSAKTLKYLLDKDIPFVQIDRFIEGLDADYVGTQNYESVRNAMAELLKKGRKNIGMITLDLEVNAIIGRRKGYEDALREAGLYRPELVKPISFDSLSEMEDALEQLSKESPDAIFFSSHRMFTLALETMAVKKNLIDPDAIFLCFDDAKSYKSLSVNELWYIEQPIEEMAKEAFALLMKKMEGNTEHSQHTFLSSLVNN